MGKSYTSWREGVRERYRAVKECLLRIPETYSGWCYDCNGKPWGRDAKGDRIPMTPDMVLLRVVALGIKALQVLHPGKVLELHPGVEHTRAAQDRALVCQVKDLFEHLGGKKAHTYGFMNTGNVNMIWPEKDWCEFVSKLLEKGLRGKTLVGGNQTRARRTGRGRVHHKGASPRSGRGRHASRPRPGAVLEGESRRGS